MTTERTDETSLKRTPPYTFVCDCCGIKQIALSFTEGDIHFIDYLLAKEKYMLDEIIADTDTKEDYKKECQRDLRILQTLMKKIEGAHLEK